MDLFITYLKIETETINNTLDSNSADSMTLEAYHYEKGRVEAFEYVLERLNEILEEEK